MAQVKVTIAADFTVSDDGGDFPVNMHDTQKTAEKDMKTRKRHYKAKRTATGKVNVENLIPGSTMEVSPIFKEDA